MANSKAAHYTVDLDLDLVPNLGARYEDYEALDPCNAVSFTSNIFNLHIVLGTNRYWSSRGGAVCRRGTFLTSEQFFTVLSEKTA